MNKNNKTNSKDTWIRQENPFKANMRIREEGKEVSVYLHEDGADFVAIFETYPDGFQLIESAKGTTVKITGVKMLRTSEGIKRVDDLSDKNAEIEYSLDDHSDNSTKEIPSDGAVTYCNNPNGVQKLEANVEEFFKEELEQGNRLKAGFIELDAPKIVRPLPWNRP